MSKLFDSHAHYFDGRFLGEECVGGPDALLSSLFDSGILCGIVNVGTDVKSTRAALAQAARYPLMYVAAGVHPSDSRYYADMEGELSALRALILENRDRVVALGEIGLDYHYPDTDREKQAVWFSRQMQMAEELSLPVVIHDREAHGDCFDMICRFPRVNGVFHSYSGSAEMARDLIARGYYISFSGTLTFKNARRVAEVAAALPRDRVLIETDCPYLAPHPHRGKLNHSGLLYLTAEKLAEVWSVTVDEAISITTANAKRFFFGET